MKKILIIAFAVASLSTAFTSCKKDVSEEELLKNQLAQADSLLKRGGVIKYTVKVVSTANSSMLKSKMSIENASVTVYQNDKVFTGQTNAMGFVTFPNMRVGTVAVNVTLKDHAEVDYVADITPQEQFTNLSQNQVVNTIRYASTMVPMFPIADPGCATITGKVTAELDLTNTTPEPAPGVKVTATVDVDDPDFVSRYIASTLSSSTPSAGRILKYAFSDASITATTDAQGVYTLKVPASINGLPIKLSVVDYQATQKLYFENDPTDNSFKPGMYNVTSSYSKSITPSEIPSVKPLYINIDEPNCPFGNIISPASYSYQIDANGTVTMVKVITKGKYSAKPAVVIINYGTGAVLEPVYNSETGEIESITIVNGGKEYKPMNQGCYILTLLTQEYRKAKIETIISETGSINKINILDKGLGYIYNPNFTTISLNSAASTPILKIECSAYMQEIKTVSIINPGRNLQCTGNTPYRSITAQQINTINVNAGISILQNIYLGTGYRN